jgi:hypothetical protein
MADRLYGFTDISFIVSACDVIKGRPAVLCDRPCGTREKGIIILMERVGVSGAALCDVIIRLCLAVSFGANCER